MRYARELHSAQWAPTLIWVLARSDQPPRGVRYPLYLAWKHEHLEHLSQHFLGVKPPLVTFCYLAKAGA